MRSMNGSSSPELVLPSSTKRAVLVRAAHAEPPQEEGENLEDAKKRRARGAAADTAAQLRGLEDMTVGELAEKFRELFGVPTRTRNKAYLKKRVAWRIQEVAEGGLSPKALERIEALAKDAPIRWRPPSPVVPQKHDETSAARDPRLPPPGTVIRRVHAGVEYQVTVLTDGFEYQGEQHRSLSRIARMITGTPWNGFKFFFGRADGTKSSAQETAA